MADKKKFMNDKRMNSNILRLYRVIGYVFLILAPIVFVDYYVDSYASFRITYNKIGKASVQSNYCVGEEIPLSERKAKWAKINHMDSVEYMILGSSRSLMFSSENLKISSFYNLGVSGGSSVKDYMAEIYILYREKKLPRYMMIEVSPSLFNANSGETRWREWGNNFVYFEKLLNGKKVRSDDSYLLGIQVKDILSPAYFQYNLRQLWGEKERFL